MTIPVDPTALDVKEQAATQPADKPSDVELARLTDELVTQFKTVFDPEIPVDIYELGLIYKVDIDDSRHVDIEMTLTAPGCPVAGEMPTWVEEAALKVEGVKSAKVNLVFDPPWSPARMSDEAKLELNML
ncbi:MAG TPA: SUF system Fe-S cluster assembly protein [Caulobacterales bacterium]|nr:SUF system Fe-S cluster assembly protein [Caulobacterales bacterium]